MKNVPQRQVRAIFFVVPKLPALGGAEEVLTRILLCTEKSGTFRPLLFVCERIARPNNYLRRLKDAGIEVSEPHRLASGLFMPLDIAAGTLATLLFPLYLLKRRDSEPASILWQELKRALARPVRKPLEKKIRAASLRGRLASAKKKTPPNVVHSHGTQEYSEIGIRWARENGVAVVHCEENDLSHAVTRRKHVYSTDRIRDIAKADVIVVKSELLRKRAHSVFGKKCNILVIANWVADLSEKCRPLFDGSSTPVIGCMGRLSKLKGIEYLLESARILRERGTRVVIQIAGDGEESTGLRKKALELGISDHVKFLGTVDADELGRFFREIDIYVQPSLTESFGLAIVEAMSARLPVVATNVGGVPEVVEDGKTGILVQERNAEALARALDRLLKDPDLAYAMGCAGRERYHAFFTEEVVWPQWEALYERLTKSDGAARVKDRA